jgi:hypothetical protein
MRYLAQPVHVRLLLSAAVAMMILNFLVMRYFGSYANEANNDFLVYYFAAQSVHDNHYVNLYSGATDKNAQLADAPENSVLAVHARAAGLKSTQQYLYPPLLADLLVPISKLAPGTAVALWRIFNLVLVSLVVIQLSRLLQISFLSSDFALLVMCALLFFPVHESVFLGQITVVMLALWAIGALGYFEGRIVLSACAFALATVLKVTPIFIVPLFVIWKDRRWLVTYFCACLALVAGMVAFNGIDSVRLSVQTITQMGSGMPLVENKSINSLVTWLYYHRVFSTDLDVFTSYRSLPVLTVISKAACGAFYAACLVFAWRNRYYAKSGVRTAVLVLFSLASLCVSPISWRHGYAIVFVALVFCWGNALRGQPRLRHVVLLALTTCATGTILGDYVAKCSHLGVVKILAAGAPILCAVLFCLDGLWHVGRDFDGAALPQCQKARTI